MTDNQPRKLNRLTACLAALLIVPSMGVVHASCCGQSSSGQPTARTTEQVTKDQAAVTVATPNHIPTAAVRAATDASVLSLDRINTTRKAGLTFKWPYIASDMSYKFFRDNATGGFKGEDFGTSFSVDADVWAGLLAGGLYGHNERWADDGLGTSNTATDDFFSIYTAKQFYGWWNVGASYTHTFSANNLNGVNTISLESNSDALSCYTGFSHKWGRFSASTTGSVIYNNQGLPNDVFETTTTVWSSSIAYQLDDQWKVSLPWSFVTVPISDGFAGSVVGDTDSWTFGPRIDYSVDDQITVGLGYSRTEGPSRFSADTIRFSFGYAF